MDTLTRGKEVTLNGRMKERLYDDQTSRRGKKRIPRGGE
jgi:hypothetical protein